MRILVTGGAGFIGSNYVHHLLHASGQPAGCCPDHAAFPERAAVDEILNVDRLTYAADLANLAPVSEAKGYRFVQGDVCDAREMDRAVAAFEPDAIVHFAAESHVDRSIDAGDVFVRTNVMGTQTLLDVARRHDVERFVHISTDEVYGSTREGSFSEDDVLAPSSPYSASKAGSDLLALAHHHTYGLDVVITRCTNNYGPRQNAEKLLPKTITNALAGRRIPVYGTGMNVRDWLYVKDHCEAIEVVRARGKSGSVYNIGGGLELPNLDVVHTVLDALGRPRDLVEFVADRKGHDWRYSLDDARTRALGWAPRVSFPEGLAFTLDWFRARQVQ